MSTSEALARERTADEIQADIAATRQSLDRKLHELEKRFNPGHQLQEIRGTIRERLASSPIAAWGAIAAVAAGSWLAISGLRRRRADTTLEAVGMDGDGIGGELVVTEITVCE